MRHRNHRDIIALLLTIAATITGQRRATIYKATARIANVLGTIREILATVPPAMIDTAIYTTDFIILTRHSAPSYGEALPDPAPVQQTVRIDDIATASYELDTLSNLEAQEKEWEECIRLKCIDQTEYNPSPEFLPTPHETPAFSFAQEEASTVLTATKPRKTPTRKKKATRAQEEAIESPTGQQTESPTAPAQSTGNVTSPVLYRKKGNNYTLVKRKTNGELLFTRDQDGQYIPQS